VQCVGVWAKDKHFYLRKYIDATRQVRAGYLPPLGTGGAAFIDLFAGPGRARIQKPVEFIDGSPLIALSHDKAPFSSVVLCDIDDENIDVLDKRTEQHRARTSIVRGNCNIKIDEILTHVPKYGLNVALIDPFGASALSFETISKLAKRDRMDLIIHFPMGDLKRNFSREKSLFEKFLGLPEAEWGVKVTKPSDIPRLIGVLRKQLGKFGYPARELRSPAVKNTTNTVLYNLVYASKHPRGDAIWQSITKTLPSGQGSLPL
jgi:three-Cys-motif partner protein